MKQKNKNTNLETISDEEYFETQGDFKITPYLFDDGILYLYYTGSISATFIQDVVSVLNEYDYINFKLILNSPGGDATPVKIAPLIFRQCGMSEVIAVSQCSSAALAICLEARKLKIPVYMDILTHVILHKSSQTELLESRHTRITKYNENLVQVFEEQFDAINKPIISKLSAEEKNNYKNGHNVYLLAGSLIEWKIFKPVEAKNFKYVKIEKPVIEEETTEILLEG